MKKFFGLIILGFAFSAFSVLSGISDVIGALKSGNAMSMAKYFDNTVEIAMPGKSNSYSKSQAEAVLRDFFSTNAVKSFSIIHQGASGGSQFCIGTLTTSTGSFRTTINLRQKGNDAVLQEIKFE